MARTVVIAGMIDDLLAEGAGPAPANQGVRRMFIAMNRFTIKRGHEADFETVWRTRESHLKDIPGFVEFLLLRGPESEAHTLYASHVLWRDKAAFEAWTQSEAFRKAHAQAGQSRDLHTGPPNFEGFEVVQEIKT